MSPESPVSNINTLTQTCICYLSSLVSCCTKEWIYDSRSLCYAPNGAVVENNDAFCQTNKCINQANGLIYSVMLQQEPGMPSSWKCIWRKVLTQYKECFTFVPGYIGWMYGPKWNIALYGKFADCPQSITGRVGGLPNNLGNVNNGDTRPELKPSSYMYVCAVGGRSWFQLSGSWRQQHKDLQSSPGDKGQHFLCI